MKVYIAGPYAARSYLHSVKEHLTKVGFTVVSDWTEQDHEIRPGTLDAAPDQTDEYCANQTRTDLRSVLEADVVVLFTGKWLVDHRVCTSIHQTTSGGRHIETGYAIGMGKRVLVIGEPENIFHRGLCQVVLRSSELIKVLRMVELQELAQRGDLGNVVKELHKQHVAKGGRPG